MGEHVAAVVAVAAAAAAVAMAAAAAADVAAAATRRGPKPIRLVFSLDGTLDRAPSVFGITTAAGEADQTIDDHDASGLQVCYFPHWT